MLVDNVADYQALFSKWWTQEWKAVPFPEKAWGSFSLAMIVFGGQRTNLQMGTTWAPYYQPPMCTDQTRGTISHGCSIPHMSRPDLETYGRRFFGKEYEVPPLQPSGVVACALPKETSDVLGSFFMLLLLSIDMASEIRVFHK